jgi:hypothetical protein
MVVRKSLNLGNVFEGRSVRLSKFLTVYIETLARQARLDMLRPGRIGAASPATEHKSDLNPLVGVRSSYDACTWQGRSFAARYCNAVSFFRHDPPFGLTYPLD